jgi:hypothetical protein
MGSKDKTATTKVVIVGGVACGATCAARLRRLDENTEIREIGRFIGTDKLSTLFFRGSKGQTVGATDNA